MARPVYSERFFAGLAGSGTIFGSFTVPAGKRAVVTSLTFLDGTAGGTGSLVAFVGPGSTQFLLIANPVGPVATAYSGLHLVFYSGESFAFYRASGQPFVSSHGYLLDA